MTGKVDPEMLSALILGRTGAADAAVLQGAAYGEDAAAIDVDGTTLVVSADPISLAASDVGVLGVHVACNDVAASGADPRWLTNVLLLPEEDPGTIEAIVDQLDRTATEVGVAIVGGHAEVLDGLERPLLSLTCMGTADRFIPTGGAQPGDRVILTKGAAIEGTAILAADFRDRLDGVPAAVVDRAARFLELISVLPEARLLRRHATSMHDPTEGGIRTGLVEMARAASVRLEITPSAIPVRTETERLFAAVGIDPLETFGSGALIATVPRDLTEGALEELSSAGIAAAEIGEVRSTDDPRVTFGDEVYRSSVEDAMYPLWETAGE